MEEQLMDKNDDIKETKFCKECGEKIDRKAVFCTHCGCMVENIQVQQPQIVINNRNQIQNVNIPVTRATKEINKWVAFFLCLFLGCFGAHKFYEGKSGMGVLYIFTCGLFAIGWFVDCIVILCKTNPYYVD